MMQESQMERGPTTASFSSATVGERLPGGGEEQSVREFQQAQIRLWWELQELGNPWLVTDLVTLGSPLAHAAFLLAQDENDLRRRQRQRELPTCPPVAERDDKQ